MRGVFFDWDGTLVDSLPLLFASHNHVRERMGLTPWTRDEYRNAIVFSTRELYPRIYGDHSAEAQEMLYAYIKDNHLKQLSLLDGAYELVARLHEKNVPMGIVSNKRHDVLRREVEHLGWEKYFGVYNGAGVAKMDKPSGLPLIHAIEEHPASLSASEIIYVGDTESDLGCAAEAGCPVAYIRHDTFKPELISKYNPMYVVNSLAELEEKLMEFLHG